MSDADVTLAALVARIAEEGSTPDSAESPQAEHAVRILRACFTVMRPDDRVALFQRIEDGYCRHCGDEQPRNGWCQCTNDE